MIPYLVSRFAKETMTNLVRECFGYQFPDILQKPQVGYIFNYLNEMKAKSVLLEFDYVDKDFLEDFTRYYAKRYGNDGHKCARMHFFANTIDHGCITSVLEGGAGADQIVEQLQKSYLGFMVIKPLPKTFIGKTCLQVLPDVKIAGKEKQRLSRRYDVDLFGIKLSVDSIAFQEQDKVVAACATTAIWSAFHSLSWRSVRSIRSCSEITMSALNDRDGSSNSFPNSGLSSEQILRSIDAEGLRHHMESARDVERSRFFQTVVGHIDSQLPLIFVGDVFDISGRKEKVQGKGLPKSKLVLKGSHAICILGYKSDQEDVLYVHDDRYGPYVRAKIISMADYHFLPEPQSKWALGIQKMDAAGTWSEPSELIIPEVLIVPTDKKTRLPFDYAMETCERVILALKATSDHQLDPASLTFKIKLREISQVRQELRFAGLPGAKDVRETNDGSADVSQAELSHWQKLKVEFLTKGFARFQWQAQFFHEGKPAFKMFIDASDIPQGDAVTAVFIDDLALAKPYITFFMEMKPFTQELERSGQFFESFLRRLSGDEESISSYLDEKYGAVRAPAYLKGSEFQGGEIFHNPTRQILYDAPQLCIAALHSEFGSPDTDYLIWAIAGDGALVIGKELTDEDGEKCGHPSITGFKPARIAGELWKEGETKWSINSSSGRYSGDYPDRDRLLANALNKFRSFFSEETLDLEAPEARRARPAQLGPCAKLLEEVAESEAEQQKLSKGDLGE